MPVKGEPTADSVAVLVGYDGDTRTLNVAAGTSEGQGIALAEMSAEQPASFACPSDGWSAEPAARATVTCDISWSGRTPYWPGVGWAAQGE